VWLCTFAGTRDLVHDIYQYYYCTHLRGVIIACGDPWLCKLKLFDVLP
jgi:hypothetical protein